MTDASVTANTPASASSSAAAQPKASAPKDRTCPYCHISFTSSSLGRHLDLYIKEKNPKPPDGIHNVEEIRKSRGNITRRQARSSIAKRQQQETSQRESQETHTNGVSPASGVGDRRNGAQYFRQIFNTPHWTSTGVITDSDANVQFMGGVGSTSVDRAKEGANTRMDASTRRKWHEERERGRAAELALQEVLDSIKAAAPEREKPEIYDFDFFAQSFPSLCLKVLGAPPTIHMPTLISDPEAWPIDAPTHATFELLRRKIAQHLLKWRDDYYPPNPRKRPRSSGADGAPVEIHESPIEPIPLYMHFLESAYASWISLTESSREREWHIEIMRAFAEERNEHRKTRSRIDYLETELSRAKLDNARLTECQMPREWLHTPASQLPIAKLVAEKVDRELSKEGLDAEKLIAKWRPRVQASRNAWRRPGSEEREAGRLVMIGPAGNGADRLGAKLRGSYDGRIPDESEGDDGSDDEADEDEIMAEDSRGNNGPDGGKGTPRDIIEPSLRSQMENAANRTLPGRGT